MQYIPLIDYMFTIYSIYSNFNLANNLMKWNNFFRFVVLMCLTPSVAFYYWLIYSGMQGNNSITFSAICNALTLLDTNKDVDQSIPTTFQYCIGASNTSSLSFYRFILFVKKTENLWKPIDTFREAVINNIFTEDMVVTILDRNINIKQLRDYRNTFNKDLPVSCLERFKEILLGVPNKNHYDFDGDESMYNIITTYLRKFNPTKVKCEKFNLKVIQGLSKGILYKVDNFYVISFQNNKQNKTTIIQSSKLVATSSDEYSNFPSLSTNFQKTSILKTTSRLSLSSRTLSRYDSEKEKESPKVFQKSEITTRVSKKVIIPKEILVKPPEILVKPPNESL